MHSNERLKKITAALALVGSTLAAPSAEAQNNLLPGDVAIIGWVDNGTPEDVFTIVVLDDLPAGTVVYFTDNGWDSVAGAFRNPNGPNDGDGGEQLAKLEVSATIPAGTILSTTDAGPGFTWVTTGSVPGAANRGFGFLVLTQTGDQICAFQHDTGTNPLNTAVQQPLFLLDDSGTFENATSTGTGNVPPGLATASNTAVTFAHSGSGQSFMAFNTATLTIGTKAQWLAAIATAANWTFGSTGALPTGTIGVGDSEVTSFCSGDGSLAVACPCGNAGQPGRGCDNSLATGGAVLAGAGTTTPDTLVLTSSGQLTTAFSVFLQGTSPVTSGVLFGDGVRCVGGTLKKLAVRQAAGGSVSYPGPGEPSIQATSAALGDVLAAGSVRHYQVYYRDASLAFCDAPQGDSWNTTNALTVVW